MFVSAVCKTRNVCLSAGLLGLVTLSSVCLAQSTQAPKRRIAVMSLDVSQDARFKAAQLGVQNDLGVSMGDLIINKLNADGKFILIERSALDKIIKEQNLSNSDRSDQNTAVKLGKIAGVDGIIIGSVSQYSGETQTTTTPGGHIGLVPIPGTKNSIYTVTVGVTARLIDTTTGTIVGTALGNGVSTKKVGGLSAIQTSGNGISAAMVTDATTQAINQIATQIESSPLPTIAAEAKAPPSVVAPTVAVVSTTPKTPYKGVVADVSGTTLVITVGTKAGLKVNDVVDVQRFNHVVKDPTTGKIIRTVYDKLGEAKITEADATSAVATYTGTAEVKVKDQVSSQP
ncbi:curli biogenesis system outer membrane secretion channel CsgG [Granulicella aggregans]|uniref:Curli biogenesis system outer membrane secretion channel CsgG n=1 Tax=Granulicella aggregans TaxID=474949 RepID=A0A7W8E2Q1_9BACT|nr:CsgG/HfaB family protein [Granulicella aggregans]MBB5056611.1 curli biogenesis system outer membrane secretion channel CsgG [Granulicella aggregans]